MNNIKSIEKIKSTPGAGKVNTIPGVGKDNTIPGVGKVRNIPGFDASNEFESAGRRKSLQPI